MRTTFRRLLLVLCALRYGVRLVWVAAPPGDRLHSIATFISRVHASSGGRSALGRALPHLGPLVSAFAEQPELVARPLHDALDTLERAEISLTTPLSPPDVQRALHAALGPTLEHLVESVDLNPLESGIAQQVHAARLRQPQAGHLDVAIKLLRREQVQRIGDDIAILRWVARWLERFSPAARKLQLHALAESFAHEVLRRFDLRGEAANLSQTGRHFSADKRLVVPDVIWELSTDMTLAVQRIDTLPIIDVQTLRNRGVDVRRVATNLVEVVIEQIFEHGFFHAALDARRIRVSIERDSIGRLVLADCSIMSSLAEPQREFFVHGATALFERNYGRLADMHREHRHVASHTRTEMLEAELRTRSEAHFAAPHHERESSALLTHLLEAVEPFEGAVPEALVLAQRTLAQAEALARALVPEIDTWTIVKDAFVTLARRDIGHHGLIKRLARELPHLAPIMPRLPLLIAQRLSDWHARREAVDTTGWQRELREWRDEERRMRWVLWLCAIGGAILGASAVVLTH
jgi:ubiquinone biosynthesis protein